MSTITRLCVGQRLSEGSVFNGIVHLGGMVPESGATDIRGQTADVLAQVDAHLAACGSDKNRILRVQIYLANIADIGGMNAVWDAWVAPGHAPPRATVQARLARPGLFAPSACPTRVIAAIEKPKPGIIEKKATCCATCCDAATSVPSLKTITLKKSMPPARKSDSNIEGRPMLSSRLNGSSAGRQPPQLARLILLFGRSSRTISTRQPRPRAPVVASPAPNAPSVLASHATHRAGLPSTARG